MDLVGQNLLELLGHGLLDCLGYNAVASGVALAAAGIVDGVGNALLDALGELLLCKEISFYSVVVSERKTRYVRAVSGTTESPVA